MHKGSNPINLIFRFLLELALVIDENGGFTISPEFEIPAYSTLFLELVPAKQER